MNQRPTQITRFHIIAALSLALLCVYLVVLFNIQVVHHEDYLAQSIQTITRVENVKASRGIITDRSGRTLVSNQYTYSLTFDPTLLRSGEDQNEAILRLVTLCREQGVAWEDNLPLSLSAPAQFTLDGFTDTQKARFFAYLRDLKPAQSLLAAYARTHTELLKPPAEGSEPQDLTLLKDAELAKQIDSSLLTTALLEDMGFTPALLMQWMRADMSLSEDYTDEEARLILGVRYELKLRKLGANNNAYVLAQNVDVPFCSLISDGDFRGARIIRSSTRAYSTTYAAHILGTVGGISDYTDELKAQGYKMNDTVGLTGVEAAFEQYLRGTDGKQMISVNSDGKITGEYYSVEPRSGYTVELTIDLDLQQSVEDALASAVESLNAKDGLDSRGAAAAVVKVGTGEILSLASYPTFDLSTWRQDYAELSSDPATPMLNRAASSAYAPGSTLKPATAVAALESGATTPSETLFDTGYWKYPSTTWNGGTWCWKHSGHGKVNATTASLVVAQLLYLEAQDPDKDIQLYINSPGGSVTAGMAIYDTMKYIKCDVSTVCIGMAASMGAFLLAGGAKGKRFALPNAEIMIHQPLGGTQGQATEIEIAAKHILRTKEKLNRMLAENTGKDYETICADTERDNWKSAEEACEYGLIDKVITFHEA